MKIYPILFFATFYLNLCFAQIDVENQGSLFIKDSKVGIGTNAPLAKFHLKDSNFPISIFERTDRTFDAPWGAVGLKALRIGQMGNGFGPAFTFHVQDNDGIDNTIGDINVLTDGSDDSGMMTLRVYSQGIVKTAMTIKNNGNIGIGTISPSSKLSVNGNILSEEISVVQNIADYVFNDDYNLLTLDELEEFIKINKCLPKIQNRFDVSNNNGYVDLGRLSISLLEKIEELTLYLIQINNINSDLQERISALENLMSNKD
jgi:hypothetical protein